MHHDKLGKTISRYWFFAQIQDKAEALQGYGIEGNYRLYTL